MMHKSTGNVLWVLLHAYAMVYPEKPSAHDRKSAEIYLKVFAQCVADAANGCPRCSREWNEIVRQCPIPLDSQKAFYEWTIAAHDRVNASRGKQVMHPNISLHHPIFATM